MDELKKQLLPSVIDHLWLFLLPALCLLLYLPSLQHDFISDDRALVVENPYIKSWKYLPEMLSKDVWNIHDTTNYWRPVFSLSLALDYSLWGLNPLGFHLTNILLHAINTALLFSLGKRLQSPTCALFAALLFAVHPMQAQAVNVVSIRGDLLAAFFTLLSVHGFFSRRTIPFAVAMMLALLSKETSVVFPLALLFAWIIIQKDKQDLRFLLLAFVILCFYLVVRLSLGFSFSLIPLIFSYHASTANRLLLVFKVLALYFLALFNLFAIPHPFWTVEVPTSLRDPYVISGILISGLLIVAIWRSLRKNPVIAFGLMWFVIYFLPISNLKQLNQPMAEHWLYIPMIGLSLAFGGTSNALFVRLPKLRLIRAPITAGVAVYLIFGALVAREKTKVYKDDESFWIAAIRANPGIAGLYSILGTTYLVKQDISRAKEFYAKALTLDPNDFSTNYMLGSLLYRVGQLDEAKIYLERITRVKPRLKMEFGPVAHAWEMLDDKENALFYYRKALELNPESAQIKQKVLALEEATTLPLR